MDKTVPIPDQPYPPEVNPTLSLGSDLNLDTDLLQFTKGEPRAPFPSKRRTLRLYMPQEVEPMILMDVERLIIGRAKGEQRLDLSLQYAKMLGVSREHAEITFADGQYHIKDLGSTNGTFLNNLKLEADKTLPLENSDQLRFGHLIVIVNFS